MGLKLITAPLTYPLTLAEAKDHLRQIDSDDDAYIQSLIIAATGYCEGFTGRAFIDQTWDYYLDQFPVGSSMEIKIPKPPLIEVTQIAYDDTAGVEQIIDPSSFFVDSVSEPGWIVPAGTLSWPTPIDAINSVRVRFRAGYLNNDSPPAAAVPDAIKSAIKLTMGTLYEHREQIVVGTITNKLPWGVEQLLRQHRVLLGMA